MSGESVGQPMDSSAQEVETEPVKIDSVQAALGDMSTR